MIRICDKEGTYVDLNSRQTTLGYSHMTSPRNPTAASNRRSEANGTRRATRPRILVAVVTLGLMATAAPVNASRYGDQDSSAVPLAPSSGPVVASGKLLDRNGKAAKGKVFALVWPGEDLLKTLSDGDRIETPTVGWTETKASGSFEIGVDPALIPKTHLRKDGGLNLLLIGTDDDWEGSTFTPAPAPEQVDGLAAARSGGSSSSAEEAPSVTLKLTDARSADSPAGGITPQSAPDPIYRCNPWTLLSSSLVWVTAGQSFSGPATNWAGSQFVTLGDDRHGKQQLRQPRNVEREW